MKLPSLTALRAFEAAARTGSFSAAARELNVTHAAISQQVRALEEHLGWALAVREGRGVALTDEGKTLATALHDGFATIAEAIQALTEDDLSRPLSVSITPNFARQWLMPRLGAFWASHPDIPLSLHPDARVVDLRAERIDLAIRFGQGAWPGVEAEMLAPACYTIVAAPSLVGEGESLTLEQMAKMPWIIETDWPEQLTWLRAIGINPDQITRHDVPTEDLAFSAARQGYGLHVELSALLDEDMASGRLREIYTPEQPGCPGYWLVTRPGPLKPALRTFIRWLKSVA